MGEKMRIGLKQIAEAAGVSLSTTSMVLNNKGNENRIALETQERIKQAARELGYCPRMRNRPDERKTPIPIGIFQPTDLERSPLPQFFTGAMKCIEERALNFELMVVLYKRGALEEKRYLLSTEKYFRGVVVLGMAVEDVRFLQQLESRIPVVIFNREVKGYHSVKIDDYEVGQYACNHFLKRGHRNLSLVMPDYSSKSLSMRLVGYMDRFYEFQGNREQAPAVIKAENTEEGGFDAAKDLLALPDFPTAVFVSNDEMMQGLIRGLEEGNKKIAKDIEVISFGNRPVNIWNHPQITSFSYPVENMAYDCMQILYSEIEEGPTVPVMRNYVAECIFRESCPAETDGRG